MIDYDVMLPGNHLQMGKNTDQIMVLLQWQREKKEILSLVTIWSAWTSVGIQSMQSSIYAVVVDK